MITNVTNHIVDELTKRLVGVDVVREYPDASVKFPCVVVEEGDLPADERTFDSDGYQHTMYNVSLEIFTEGTGKISRTTNIRSKVDELLSGEYKMRRVFSNAIPNMGDLNVYRYRMAYSCRLDKNNTIYRG